MRDEPRSDDDHEEDNGEPSHDSSSNVEMEMILNDETDHDEAESQRRDNVREQYRRRLTIDPLSDFIISEELRRIGDEIVDEEAEVDDQVGETDNANVQNEYLRLLLGDDDMYDFEQNHVNDDSSEPPRPARDHIYLPTAQPLYPEEWVPAGRYRQQGKGSGSFDNRESMNGNDVAAASNHERPTELAAGSIDCRIPAPPGLLSANPKYSNHMCASSTDVSLTTLPILEIDNVVLFPGSTLPLRLHDSNWIEYLGYLIDDARGLYGSRLTETEGRNPREVRIGIVPRIRRRTRRRPQESGAQTGRWRVDLIRRGATPLRRPAAVTVDEARVNMNAQNDNEDEYVQQEERESTPTAQQQQQEQQGDDDGIFHPSSSRARTIQHDDPLIGRIGTIATIIFTHEETECLVDVPARNNWRGRQSSTVWRRHTDELVLTAIGTSRFRINHSCGESTSGYSRDNVPLYEVEELSDGNVTIPQELVQMPGDCNNSTMMYMPISGNEAEAESKRDSNDVSEGQDLKDEVDGGSPFNEHIHNKSIFNLAFRSSTPSMAYRSIWPWRISQQICVLLQRTDSFQGIYSSLVFAAGVCTFDDNDGLYISVVDNSAFANWLSSNLPLDQNDRLDILEMTDVVQQLLFIYKKISGMAQPLLRCRHCGTIIANMSEVFTVGGAEGTTGAYVNEYGVVHQTLTVREVDPEGIIATGYPETKDSWFPGYAWFISHCRTCHSHLGWKFRNVGKRDSSADDPNRPYEFWGLSSVTTEQNVVPQRLREFLVTMRPH